MTPEKWQIFDEKQLQGRMHYYNPAVHQAAFALPEFARKQLAPMEEILAALSPVAN
jgi:spermidine synthase